MKIFSILAASLVLANAQRIRPRAFSKECVNANLDIYFLVDVSSSVVPGNIRYVRDYLTSITNRLRIAPAGTRISLTTFGKTVNNLGALKNLRFPLKVRNKIRSIVSLPGGGVSPVEAMDYMANNLFTKQHGLRMDRSPVCVVILSTRFQPLSNVTAAGLRLQKNCKVVAIGAGDAALPRSQVSRIASPPRRRQTILSRRHLDLPKRIQTTLRLICKTTILPPITSVKSVGPTSFRVKWEPQPSIASYMAAVQLLGRSRLVRQRPNIPANQNEVGFANLEEASTYLVFVWARSTDGTESTKSRVLVTTSLPMPDVKVDQSTITTSSAYISWGKTSDLATSYYITVIELDNTADRFVTRVVGTNYSIKRLSPGTRYKVSVSTLSGGIRSQESDPAFFVTVTLPPAIQMTKVQHDYISCEWEPVKGGRLYNLFARNVETSEELKFVNLTATSLTISNLTPSNQYEISGRTVGEKGVVSARSKYLYVVTAPSNPDKIEITEVNTTSITFHWNEQPATFGYRIYITSSSDLRYNLRKRVAGTQFTATNMQPGTFYRVLVLSIGLNDLVDSNVVYPLEAQTVPSPPTTVKVVSTSASTAEVGWQPVRGVRRYIVFSEPIEGMKQSGNVTQSFNRSLNTAVVENLYPGTLYDFRVIGEGIQTQKSQPSPSIRESTFAAVPRQPKATQVNGSSMVLKVDPAAGAVGYILQIQAMPKEDRRASNLFQRKELRDHSDVTIDGLQNGVWYIINVKSKSAFGKVNPQPSESLLEQTVPAPPTEGTVVRTKPTSIKFKWRSVKGAVSYILHVESNDYDEGFTKKYAEEFPTNETEYLVNSLRPGALYEFRLQSVGYKLRKSDLSSPVFKRTIPGVPANVRRTTVTETSVSLKWDSTKGADSYLVVASSLVRQENFKYNTTEQAEATVTGLYPGYWYNLTVHARGESQQLNPTGSPILKVQTVPLPPRFIEIHDVKTTSFVLTWESSVGAVSYVVNVTSLIFGENTTRLISSNMTSMNVSGLLHGMEYAVTIVSVGHQSQQSIASELASDTTVPKAVSGIEFNGIKHTSLSLHWDDVKGAISYEVHYRPRNSNEEYDIIETASSSAVVIDDLEAGLWYEIIVFSVGEGARRNEKSSVEEFVQTLPLPPTSLEITDVTTTSLVVLWEAAKGAVSYRLSYIADDSDSVVEIVTSLTSLELSDLLPGTEYSISIQSIAENEESDGESDTIFDVTVPNSPSQVEAEAIRNTSIDLRWQAPQGAVSYNILVRNTATNESRTETSSTAQVTINELLPGIFYELIVFSLGTKFRLNEEGSGRILRQTVPKHPENISTSHANTSSIRVNWQAVIGASSYTVSVTLSSSSAVIPSEMTSSSTSVTFIGLSSGTEYLFSIVAVGFAGLKSQPGLLSSQTALPRTPDQPVTIGVTSTSIAVEWPTVAGAAGYRVLAISTDNETHDTDSSSTFAEITSLSPGTHYAISVLSIAESGLVNPEKSLPLTRQTVADAPTGLSVSEVKVTSFIISWQPVTGAEKYIVTILSSDAEARKQLPFPITTTETSVFVQTLLSGTRYDVSVIAKNFENRASEDSAEISTTTLPHTPDQPQVVAVQTDSISFHWPSVKGTLNYNVELRNLETEETLKIATESTQAQFENLEPGTFYEAVLFSVGESGVNAIESESITSQTVPLSPSEVHVSLAVNELTSLSISWEPTKGAEFYEVEVTSFDDVIIPSLILTPVPSTVVEDLSFGTEYYVTVRAVGEQGQRSNASAPVLGTTIPTTVNDLIVVVATSNTASLVWSPAKGAISYRTVATDADTNATFITETASQVAIVTSLEPGTIYEFVVYSVGSSGENPIASKPVRKQTLPAAPQNIIFLTENYTPTSISLSWSPVKGAISYIITYGQSGTRLNSSVTSDVTTVKVTDLIPGTTYSFRVVAIGQEDQRGTGSGVSSSATKPVAVKTITVAGVTSSAISLSWGLYPGAILYRVVITTFDDENITTSFKTTQGFGVASHLHPGSLYRIQVISVGVFNITNVNESVVMETQTVPIPPRVFEATVVGTDSVTLLWSTSKGATGYIVTAIWMELGARRREFPSDTTSVVATGLVPGTKYSFVVRSLGVEGAASEASHEVRETTRSEVVTNLVASDVTTESTTLQWDAVKGSNIYVVHYGVRHDHENHMVIETEETEITIDSLQPGIWYEFVVFSTSAGKVRNEESSAILHLQTVPLPPHNLIISEIRPRSLKLRWDNVTGAQSYSVRIVHPEENRADTIVPSSKNALKVRKLRPGETYRFHVTTIGQESRRSTESDVISETTVPDLPRNIRLTSRTTESATLLWDVVNGALSYIAVVHSVHYEEALAVQTETNTVTLQDLLPGGWYDVTVTSVGVKNRLNPFKSEEIQLQTVPEPPTTITTVSVTTHQIKLEWNEVLGAHYYKVRVSTKGADDVVLDSASHEFSMQDLLPGTSYNFNVVSIGEQGQRSIESRTTVVTTVPNPPTNLRLVSQTTTTANITWNNVKGATQYVINGRSNNTRHSFTLRSRSNSALLSELFPGAWYTIAVTSVGAGERMNPLPTKAITFQTVPLPPNNLRVTAVTTTRITLRWDAVHGASSYLLKFYDANNTGRQETTSRTVITIRSLSSGRFYNFTMATMGEQSNLMSHESARLSELTRSGPPSFLTVGNETSHSVELLWQAVLGTVSYKVMINSEQDERILQVSSNLLTVTKLNPGQIYSFQVVSVDVKGRQSSEASQTISVVTATLTPSNMRVVTLKPRRFSAVWDAVQGALQYEVAVLLDGNVVINKTVKRARVYVGSLMPGNLYSISVKGININGKKSEAAVVFQRTVPLSPSSISVVNIRPTHLNLTWDAVNGASSYDVITKRLYRPRTSVTSTMFTSNMGTVKNLAPGAMYRITVFSVTEEKIRSIANTTFEQSTLPAAPRNLVAESNDKNSFQLDWGNVRGARFYTVYIFTSPQAIRKSSGEIEMARKIERLKSSDVVVDGFQPGINYTFMVTASAAGLESDKSRSVTSQTRALSPKLPASLFPLVAISDVTKTNFTCTWKRIKHAVGYIIIAKTQNVDVRNMQVRGFRNTQVVVANLSPDTDYNVTMKAVGVLKDETEESFPPANVKTRPLAPGLPANVTITKIRATFMELAWNPSPRALTYVVKVLDSSSGRRRRLTNIRVAKANITGLTELNDYVIQVLAVGAYERSPSSKPVTGQARHPVPIMPRDSRRLITISNISHNSMQIEVDPIVHADTYILFLKNEDSTFINRRNAQPATPVLLNELEQNTLYDITYVAVGHGGDKSEESETIRVQTLRMIPEQPVDFQVVSVTSSVVTVQWLEARFAVRYRIRAQNMRTGVVQVFKNARSPFEILGLDYSETYNITAASIGEYFESEYITPISINIPFPGADSVTGIRADLVTNNGFRLQWLPTPFAVSYTIWLSTDGRMLQEITGIRKIWYRLTGLKPGTTYNVTVRAVSHNGRTTSSGDWIKVSTGRQRGSATATPPTKSDEENFEELVEAFVQLLLEQPESSPWRIRNWRRRQQERRKRAKFTESVENKLQEMMQSVEAIFISKSVSTNENTNQDAFDPPRDSTDALQTLLSVAREMKSLVNSSDATEATADSIATRLTSALAALITSSSDTSTPQITRDGVNKFLFPFIHHQMEDLLVAGGVPVVVQAGPATRLQYMTTLVNNRTITATGFSVVWGGRRNTHRYRVTVVEVTSGPSPRTVFDSVRSGRSAVVSDLEPSTFYDVTILPVESSDEVIPGVVGRIRVRTSDPIGETFEVKISSVGYNDITLSWDQFPSGVPSLLFTIKRKGALTDHQQFSVSQVHSSIMFTSLQPATNYDITVTSSQSNTILSTTIKTLYSRPGTRSTEIPISNALAPPSGLRVVWTTSQSVTVEWFPTRISRVPSAFLRYNIRLYAAGSSTLQQFFRQQRNTRITILRLRARLYDVTVSTYNSLTRRESEESPRLRFDFTKTVQSSVRF